MVVYRIRKIDYEDIDLDPAELMTIMQAAEYLGLSRSAVKANLDANRFTETIDPNKRARASGPEVAT